MLPCEFNLPLPTFAGEKGGRSLDPVECYIVRIYRRGNGAPTKLEGVVEKVGVEGKKPFHDVNELWDILNSKGKADSVGRKRKS